MIRQLANWFRRKKLESGLDRELRYHLERRIIDLERSGLPTGEARRQALLELGGVAQIQEEVRDIWLSRWLRDFTYDLRFSARSFLKAPHGSRARFRNIEPCLIRRRLSAKRVLSIGRKPRDSPHR
jgi:hypothetical protein